MITTREQVIMKAWVDWAKEYAARMNHSKRVTAPAGASVTVPPPAVVNEVSPTPLEITNDVHAPVNNVSIDMTPVANALDRMTQALVENSAHIAKLLKVLSDKPNPVVNVAPNIDITTPKPSVVVKPPVVNVKAPKVEQVERPKRTFRVKHDDGTTSTIEEV